MSDAPNRPDEGESTLGGEKPAAWKRVNAPATPQFLPPPPPGPGGNYYGSGPGYVPPPNYPPPGSSTAAGQAGYRPVYDGRAPGSASPPNYPPGYFPPGYGGYPQNNYGRVNGADMLAAAMLYPRWRRRRRHLFFWPILLVFIVMMVVMHGCMSFVRMF